MGKIKRFTVSMAIAAVAGAIAGVLLAPKKGKETRAEVKKKADKLSKAFKETKTQIEARSKKVFKDAGHQSVGIYTRAKGMVLGEVEAIKDRGEISKADFDRIVDKVVGQVKKEKKVAVPTAKGLATELKKDWGIVQKNFFPKPKKKNTKKK